MELNLTNAMPFSFFDYSFKIMSSIEMISQSGVKRETEDKNF